MSDVQKFGDEFQRVGRDGFDAAVSSFGEVNKPPGYRGRGHRLFEEVVRGRHPRIRRAARCKVIRAGYRDPV